MNGQRDKVFVSYSREDKKWLDELLRALAQLSREEPERVWWDGQIKAGQEWRAEIDRALLSARVAVLLVSPSFLASEFILKEELPAILDAAKREGVAILWTLVRNCWWERTALRHFQAVPYQQTHTMRAWNALSEAELDDLLKVMAQEIVDRLQEPPASVVEAPPAEPTVPVDSSRPAAAERHQAPELQVAQAHQLLAEVVELDTVREIADLFVLRERWAAAVVTFDRLVELAAPNDELSMAWGYENLGRIHRRESREKRAVECFKLAQVLYLRSRRDEKAAEMASLGVVAPPAGRAPQLLAASRQPDSLQS